MGKKYKGKDCVYCGSPKSSVGGDHVFAREFFLIKHRNNLPQVPACRACNERKSRLEHYLLHAASFASQHNDAIETMQTLLPKRRARNKKLDSELEASRSSVWMKNRNGLITRQGVYLVDADVVRSWSSLVARGVAAFHWGLQHHQVSDPKVDVVTAETVRRYSSAIATLDPAHRIEDANLGNGTIIYSCGQSGGTFALLFKLYGGIRMSGDDSRYVANTIAAISLPSAAIEKMKKLAAWLP